MRRPKLKMGPWGQKRLLTPPPGDFRRAKFSLTEQDGTIVVRESRLRSHLVFDDFLPDLVRVVLLSEWKDQGDEEIIEALRTQYPKKGIRELLECIHAAEKEGFFDFREGPLNLFEKLSRMRHIALGPVVEANRLKNSEIERFENLWCVPLFGAILWSVFSKKDLTDICQAEDLRPEPGYSFLRLRKSDLVEVMSAFSIWFRILPTLQDRLNLACHDQIAHIRQMTLPEIEGLWKDWQTRREEGVCGKFLWAFLVEEREGIEQSYEPILETIVQPYHETESPIPMELFSRPSHRPKPKPIKARSPQSASRSSAAKLLKQLERLKQKDQKSRQRIQELRLKNAELKRQISHFHATKGQLAGENRELARQVQRVQAQLEQVKSAQEADAQLRQTVKIVRKQLYEAERRIQYLEAQLSEKETQFSKLRAELYRLKAPGQPVPSKQLVEEAPTPANEQATSKPLAGKTIAIIGGRDNLGTRYAEMVEELGGVLKWHCGVEGLGYSRIEDALIGSHGCLIITGAVKHSARESAIRSAQNLKIPCWSHASPGISSIRRFLIEHAHELAP